MNKTAFLILFVMGLVGVTQATTSIVPFTIRGIDEQNRLTIQELFHDYYQAASGQTIVVSEANPECSEIPCHVIDAKAKGADHLIFGSIKRLGQKWIVTGTRVEVKTNTVVGFHKLDCRSLEGFDPVMKRLARALAEGKTLEEVVDIHNVTEEETDETRHRRRAGLFSSGFRYGYLFPTTKGSYLRDVSEYRWIEPVRQAQFSQIINTDWVTWMEFSRNYALEWDLHVGWGAEIGSHLSMVKLFSDRDFAPFVGGGLGINYVFAGNYSAGENKANSGPTLTAKTGLVAFRTYNFRVLFDVNYKVVLNHDTDQGIQVGMGLLWNKPRNQRRQYHNDSAGGVLKIIGGVVVAFIVIAVVAD